MKNILTRIFVTSFLGWDNWRYLIVQLIYCFSFKESIFSTKKIFAIFATISGIAIILCYVWGHRYTIKNAELLADAAVLLSIGGYHVMLNQQQKKDKLNSTPDNSAPDNTADQKQ